MPAANTTVEQLREGVDFASGTTKQLVLKRIPAHFLIMDGVGFAFDSAVLQPVAMGSDRSAPLTALRDVLEYAQDNAGKKLLIVGHTDTSGGAGYNQTLSEARAKNVHAMLTGARADWAAQCQARFQVADVQVMLAWAATEHGYPCDPGAVDGALGPKTRAARTRFRHRYNEDFHAQLPLEGEQAIADWQAYFDLMQLSLSRELGLTVSALSAQCSALSQIAPPTLGCGESFPVSSIGVDGLRSAANRRVDFVFFDEDGFPDLTAQDPPGFDLYASQLRFRRARADVEPDVALVVLDEAGVAQPGAKVELSKLPDGPVQTQTADSQGCIRVPAKRGEGYRIVRVSGPEPLLLLTAQSTHAVSSGTA